MFPAVSFAFTVKVCDPSGVAAKVFGLVQAAKAPASSLHWKPPEIVSLALKAKSGVVSLVGSTGFVPKVIVGASVSIVQVCPAGPLWLPAGSMALTLKL